MCSSDLIMKRRTFISLMSVMAAAGVLTLSGCSNSSGSTAASGTAASVAPAAGDQLSNIQSSGKLIVALEGAWQPWSYHDESDTLVGYDVEVSRAIAEKLGVEPVMLETLLAEADAVSLHVPLTPDTRQLFDAGRLARMKPGAVLINTARGGIVEEAALADALRSGRLAGAMVDVFEKEPLPAGSPLADVPNCLLTPHIAGVTRESNVRVSAVVARKVAECLRGAA